MLPHRVYAHVPAGCRPRASVVLDVAVEIQNQIAKISGAALAGVRVWVIPVGLYEDGDGRSGNMLPDITVLLARCKKLRLLLTLSVEAN